MVVLCLMPETLRRMLAGSVPERALTLPHYDDLSVLYIGFSESLSLSLALAASQLEHI